MAATKQVREVSPLPAGRYWLTLLGPSNVRDFDQWVADMSGAVRIETSELEPGARSEFVIFNVPAGRSPFLNSAQFGFPNTAPSDVRSRQDVEQAPIPPDETLTQAFGSLAAFGSPLVLIVLAVILLSNAGGSGLQRSGRRRYA